MSVPLSLKIYTKMIPSWWKQKRVAFHFELRNSVEAAQLLTFGLCVRRGIRIRPARYKCRLKILNTIYNKMPINKRPAPTEFEQRYIAELFSRRPDCAKPAVNGCTANIRLPAIEKNAEILIYQMLSSAEKGRSGMIMEKSIDLYNTRCTNLKSCIRECR